MDDLFTDEIELDSEDHNTSAESEVEADRDKGNTGLVDAAYEYLVSSDVCRYPKGCSEIRKRAIRKKAKMFIVRDGVMLFKKKKRGKVV